MLQRRNSSTLSIICYESVLKKSLYENFEYWYLKCWARNLWLQSHSLLRFQIEVFIFIASELSLILAVHAGVNVVWWLWVCYLCLMKSQTRAPRLVDTFLAMLKPNACTTIVIFYLDCLYGNLCKFETYKLSLVCCIPNCLENLVLAYWSFG
jgi:hypothetical protein